MANKSLVKYTVTGMSCAACQARVEKAVSSVPGVSSCAVSLLTNSMGVEGSASEQQIIQAVRNAGYDAHLLSDDNSTDLLKDTESPLLIKRLVFSLVFLLALMYVSMGHLMLGLPLPAFLSHKHFLLGIVQLVLSAIVLFINRKFFISGTKALCKLSPNMDTLIALGAGVSFVYSLFVLFTTQDVHSLYFESAAMIVTLITVGKLLESLSKGRTTNALKSLLRLAPKTAVVLRDGKEVTLALEEVCVGDIFVVRPGQTIPVDGVVTEGQSAVDESALTGESIPVDKSLGSSVSAATLNMSGFLTCRATRVGKDTTLSQIIQLVSDAANTKAPVAKIADKVSAVFVPSVMAIALCTCLVWLLVGKEIDFALSRAIAVLVISCPCALGLATPVAIMVANGVGAKNGILFKTAESIEQTGRTQIVAFDKTGTVTEGKPQVTDVITADGISEDELLQTALSVEAKSEHPLAKAIVSYALSKGLQSESVFDFKALSGHGVVAKVQEKEQSLCAGSLSFMKEQAGSVPQKLIEASEALSAVGKTTVAFSRQSLCLGIIALTDTIKADSKEAIRQLTNMGIATVLLTGDSEKAACAVAQKVGIATVVSQVLPEQKEAYVKQLMQKGLVAMTGDGINDAPALTRAHVGIAIGAGTDIAIDAADVVLVNSKLSDVSAAVRLSRATLRNIKENLFWAFIYNIVLIPVAAGVWYSSLGLSLNPMMGALAMSLSSFFVVTNALRLNLLNIHDSRHDKKRKSVYIEKIQKEESMERTIRVEGMMCAHCEAHVKEALEAVDGITSAVANHDTASVVITCNKNIDDAVLAEVIQKAGYTFKG